MYYLLKNVYQEHFKKVENVEEFVKKLPDVDKYYIILHDKDFFETGEMKKPHYHVVIETSSTRHDYKQACLYQYKSPKTFTEAEAVRNIKAHLRYLTHKDNKEKAQYTDNEIVTNDREGYLEAIQQQLKESATEVIIEEIEAELDNITNLEEFTERDLKKLCMAHYKKYKQANYYMIHMNSILKYFHDYISLL